MGLKFSVMPAEIDEDKIRLFSPSQTVKKIALLKAQKIQNYLIKHAIARSISDDELIVIAADTMVYSQKKFIGKPKDKNHAKEILRNLSGTTHWLYSGICVLQTSSLCHSRSNRESIKNYQIDSRFRGNDNVVKGNDKMRVFLDFDKSKVTFRKLTKEEIENYVQNNPVELWAGAYTIEKGTPGASFIKEIKGSKSNVLGLPVKKLRRILSDPGYLSHLGNLD